MSKLGTEPQTPAHEKQTGAEPTPPLCCKSGLVAGIPFQLREDSQRPRWSRTRTLACPPVHSEPHLWLGEPIISRDNEELIPVDQTLVQLLLTPEPDHGSLSPSQGTSSTESTLTSGTCRPSHTCSFPVCGFLYQRKSVCPTPETLQVAAPPPAVIPLQESLPQSRSFPYATGFTTWLQYPIFYPSLTRPSVPPVLWAHCTPSSEQAETHHNPCRPEPGTCSVSGGRSLSHCCLAHTSTQKRNPFSLWLESRAPLRSLLMWPTPAAEGHNLETYPPTLVTQNDATMTTKRGDEV